MLASYFTSTVDSSHKVVLIISRLGALTGPTTIYIHRGRYLLQLGLLGISQHSRITSLFLLQVSIGFVRSLIAKVLLASLAISGWPHLLHSISRTEGIVVSKLGLVFRL